VRPEPAAVPRRPLGATGLEVSALALSGAYQLPVASLREAHAAGVNLFFWEPRYLTLTRFVREQRCRRAELVLAAGSFGGSPAAVEADLDTALRRLRTDHLDLFLIFWVRSAQRLDDELHARLMALKAAGKVRAIGFSTHHRALAAETIARQPWDAIMIRHSAAHPGAEHDLLPIALERHVGVLTFSALCYGQLLRRMQPDLEPPSAADCYRYTLSQPGVAACLSAPRRRRELEENLAVLASPLLSAARLDELRAHGALVHAESSRFNTLVRQAGRRLAPEDVADAPEPEQIDAHEPPPAACEAEWPATLGIASRVPSVRV
jgi:diketogulonate reductase-like aldo/keto reductase